MAMEIKTLEIENSEEQATIEFWTTFGWNLKSSQRVYNKDSHLEQRGNETYSVTETVDYTKLVFERDKNGPNYAEIVRLEREFFQLSEDMERYKAAVSNSSKDWEKQKLNFDFRPPAKVKLLKTLTVLFIILGIIGLSADFFMLDILESSLDTEFPEFLTYLMFAIGAIGGLGVLITGITRKVTRKKALDEAMSYPNSESGKIYKAKYDEYLNKSKNSSDSKDRCERRMGQILDRLDEIV